MSRRSLRFHYLLLLFCLWFTPLVQAQTFTPLTPVETLAQEVADGVAEVAQFESLERQAAQAILSEDITQWLHENESTLDETFTASGYYGETKTGELIEDWQALGAGMGTTGAILAGAYGIWRRRRQDELRLLASGDASTFNQWLQSDRSDILAEANRWRDHHSYQSDLSQKDFGPATPWLAASYERFRSAPSRDAFRKSALRDIYARRDQALADEEKNFIEQNPKPVPPTLSAEAATLKNLTNALNQGLDWSDFGVEPRQYGIGLLNTSFQLLRRNDQATDHTAEMITQTLQTLQRAMAARIGRLPGVTVNTSTQYLQSSWRRITDELKTWLARNQRKIKDPQLRVSLYRLANGTIYDNTEKYQQEAVEFQSFDQKQADYTQAQKDWDRAWQQHRANTEKRFHDAAAQVNTYWVHRTQMRQAESTWQRYVQDAKTQITSYLNQQKTLSQQAFVRDLEVHLIAEETGAPVAQFFDWATQSPASDQSFIASQTETFTAQQAKIQSTKKQLSASISWGERDKLQEQLSQLELSQSKILESLWSVRDKWLNDQSATQTELDLRQQIILLESALAENSVHQHYQQRQLNRDFYTKYGVENRVNYLQKLIEEQTTLAESFVANGLDKTDQLMRPTGFGSGPAGTYFGQEWVRFSDITKNIALLRQGILPDQHWSPTFQHGRYYWGRNIPQVGDQDLTKLYYQYASSGDQASRDKWADDIKVAEEKLFATRTQTWNQQHLDTAEINFSEDDIQVHEDLKERLATLKSQSDFWAEQQIEDEQSFLHKIKSYGIQSAANEELPDLADFSPEEVSALVREVEGVSSMSSRFEAPFLQAYRRFPDNYDEFVFETERLIGQAQENHYKKLVEQAGIPATPVATKTVLDYLHHRSESVTDFNRQIAEVEAGIPELKRLYAGNPYLTTALAQAEAKIEALERAKVNAGTEAQAFLEAEASYRKKYATELKDLESQAAEVFSDWERFASGFFGRAHDLVQQKTDAYQPTDPSKVERVETLEEAQTREALQAIVEPVIKTFNPVLNQAQKVLSQAADQITQTRTWDPITDQRIALLNPLIKSKATQFINTVQSELGITLRVTDGLRSHEKQADLYEQGRTKEGEIVTNAQAGMSYHNYGQAIDVVEIRPDGTANYQDLDWEAIGTIGERLGFTWGGRWQFVDKPHFQMDLGQSVVTLKNSDLIGGIYYDPRRLDARIQAGGYEENYDTATDPQWSHNQIKFIKSGEKDFLHFLNHSKEEKIALLEAAKAEHSFWKILSGPNQNLGDFIGAMEDYLGRESVVGDFLEILQLASVIQSPLTNISAIIKFLSQDRIYDKVKDLLELHKEFVSKTVQTAEEAQVLAESFQAGLSDLIDTFVAVPTETNEAFEYLHFEHRASLNVDLPEFDEVESLENSDWNKVHHAEAKYHQDYSNNHDELKYINPDGREVVYIFDEHLNKYKISTQPDIAGTYNFVTPISFTNVTPLNYKMYLTKGIGHSILDVLPHKIYDGSTR